jgi:hypothetical protein
MMTLGASESRHAKYFDQFPSERTTDHEATQANHVQIVGLNPFKRWKSLMDQAGLDSRHLVRANGCPETTSTDCPT